ncbi:hypothetical protein EBT31_11240 [bacterium]|jgi:hypothetical protein|nr:hypothetical protein [bacterium]NBX49343.1 hypothetical protein [bacterium]
MFKRKSLTKSSANCTNGSNSPINLRPSRNSTYAFDRNQQLVREKDWVQFQWDVQNGGQVTKIVENYGGFVLFLRNTHGFQGEFFGGKTEVRLPAHECWKE